MSETVSALYKEGSQFGGHTYTCHYITVIQSCNKIYTLKDLNQFFKIYEPPAGGAKLLEFGGGAVVINLISAVPKCKEITFTDFREDNREWIKRWLKKKNASIHELMARPDKRRMR